MSHIEAVRRLPGFERAMAFLVIESNMHGANVAIPQYIAASNLQNVVTMREDKLLPNGEELRPGTRTTHENKVTMIEMLKTRIDSRAMMIHANFVVSQPDYSIYTEPEKEMFGELRTFTEIIKVNPRDPTVRPTKTFTGKLNGRKDDFVMSLADNVFHHSKLVADSKYARYRQRAIG